MEPALREKLEHLPAAPGVYLMRDRQGQVIYVGKARSLRERVRSYFSRTGDTRGFVPLLDRLLGDLEVVLTRTEKEALLLENELIKRHRPRFNVMLRDDKSFICLRLDRSVPFPRLEIVRAARVRDDGARYFGPYASATSIRQTLRLVNRAFHLRSCTDRAFERRRAGRERHGLLCQLNGCPCATGIAPEEYARSVDEAVMFLEGKHTELVDQLRGRMRAAAAELRFEDAARMRDRLVAVERSLEKQRTVSTDFADRDVFGLAREADRLAIYVLLVRGGRLTEARPYLFGGQEFPDEELLGSFVDLYYDGDRFIPDEVLFPLDLEDREAKAAWLSEKKGRRVKVLAPRRGERRDLVEMGLANAAQALREQERSAEEREEALARLQAQLGLSRLPRRIECYDISLFQGTAAVGSQVSLWDGEPDKARYRRYRVKTVAGTDDFAMLYEVLVRRLRRGLERGELPDLIVVDGGRGQLHSAMAAFKDVGIAGVELCSLAKSRVVDEAELGRGRGYDGAARAQEHARAGPGRELARSPERVFVPGRKDPIVLKQSSPELFVLTRARDEAHRFAITFHQKLRARRSFASALEAVSGVSEARKRALLRHFGSLKRVREASLEQLEQVAGLGPAAARAVHAFLHPGGN